MVSQYWFLTKWRFRPSESAILLCTYRPTFTISHYLYVLVKVPWVLMYMRGQPPVAQNLVQFRLLDARSTRGRSRVAIFDKAVISWRANIAFITGSNPLQVLSLAIFDVGPAGETLYGRVTTFRDHWSRHSNTRRIGYRQCVRNAAHTFQDHWVITDFEFCDELLTSHHQQID